MGRAEGSESDYDPPRHPARRRDCCPARSLSATSRGHARERDVKRYLESEAGGSWWVLRSPASKGTADLIALRAGKIPRFIEVKANVDGGPFMNFRKEERAELVREAYRAGAKAELCYWPPRGERRFLLPSEWP